MRFIVHPLHLCLWLCILAILPSCANRKSSAPEALCRIATLKGPSSMGMIQWIDSLKRQEEGTVREAQITLYAEPLQVRKLMIEGSVEMAVLPMNMAAMMYNKGIDYVMVAVPVSGSLYLVGSDTTLRHWEHFPGKRIHVMAKGMTPDALFNYLLHHHGLDPQKDLSLDYSFPTHLDLANALLSGKASAGILSEPYVSQIMEKNPAVKILMDIDRQWAQITSVPIAETALLVKKSWYQNHRSQVEEVLQAYEQSSLWVNAHPDSAATLIARHGIIQSATAAREAIPRSNLNFIRAAAHKNQIEAYLRILYDFSPQLIGDKMPDEDFYQ